MHLAASHPVAGSHLPELRTDPAAAFDRDRATRMKRAARRRVDRARHLPFHRSEPAAGLDARIRHRDGVEERARDSDPLALAARHLVRIAIGKVRIEAADREQLAHPRRAARRIGLDGVHLHRLGDDVADLHARIERAVWILEDDLDAAPQRPELLVLEPGEVDAVIDDLAGGRPLEQQDAAAGRRLAATTFADQPKRLPAAKREVDAVDGPHLADHAAREDALGDREVFPQPLHLKERRSVGCERRHATAPAVALKSWARRHAERWPAGPAGASGGRALAQASTAKRQRGRNAQPWSRRVRSGGWPSTGSRRAWRGRSSRGTDRSNAIV